MGLFQIPWQPMPTKTKLEYPPGDLYTEGVLSYTTARLLAYTFTYSNKMLTGLITFFFDSLKKKVHFDSWLFYPL